MNSSTMVPVIIVTFALIFYSVGVWSCFFSRRLKWWHFGCFVLGLIFDTWGTSLMFGMASGVSLGLHGISGWLAIILMFINAARALFVLLKKDEKAIRNFHKFALVVWFVWLIPYLTPMFLNVF